MPVRRPQCIIPSTSARLTYLGYQQSALQQSVMTALSYCCAVSLIPATCLPSPSQWAAPARSETRKEVHAWLKASAALFADAEDQAALAAGPAANVAVGAAAPGGSVAAAGLPSSGKAIEQNGSLQIDAAGVGCLPISAVGVRSAVQAPSIEAAGEAAPARDRPGHTSRILTAAQFKAQAASRSKAWAGGLMPGIALQALQRQEVCRQLQQAGGTAHSRWERQAAAVGRLLHATPLESQHPVSSSYQQVRRRWWQPPVQCLTHCSARVYQPLGQGQLQALEKLTILQCLSQQEHQQDRLPQQPWLHQPPLMHVLVARHYLASYLTSPSCKCHRPCCHAS